MHPPYFKIMDEVQEGLRYVPDAEELSVGVDERQRITCGVRDRNCAQCTVTCTANIPLTPTAAPCRYVFQTDTKYTLCMSGTGHAGMEAAIANLVEPGETVVVGNKGLPTQSQFMSPADATYHVCIPQQSTNSSRRLTATCMQAFGGCALLI